MTNRENVKSIWVARQPIFDAKKNVYAYQLLFQSGFHHFAEQTDDGYATVRIVSNSLVMGLNRLSGEKHAFIPFDRQLLVTMVPQMFPNKLLAVEILDRMELDKHLMDALKKIKASGYLLVLDDFVFDHDYLPLLELTDIIKIDFTAAESSYKETVHQLCSPRGIKLLAEKIENQEQFDEAHRLGFSYFQGFFFQAPEMIRSRELPGIKANYLQILRKVCESDLSVEEIERILKHDVSLTYKLLRFINSASYGFRVTVRSIKHALMLLGKREIRKWLSMIALSGMSTAKPVELLLSTIVRARFCEIIGQVLKLKEKEANLFLVGMFSMAEAFMDKPMKEILDELPFDDSIKSPLLGNPGITRDILNMVMTYEKADWAKTTMICEKLGIARTDLLEYYTQALDWVKRF